MTDLTALSAHKYLTLSKLEEADTNGLLTPFKVLGISNPRQLLYHYTQQLFSIPQCPCGNKLEWHADRRRYRAYCSKKCTATYSQQKAKLTNIEKYGASRFSQTAEFRDKIKKTSLQKFGTEHYSQTAEWVSRTAATNQYRFGVDRPAQNSAIAERTKQTNIARYGSAAPAGSAQIIQKIKQTNLQTRGVDNPSKAHYSADALEFLTNLELFASECAQLSVADLANKYQISVKPIYDRINALELSIPKNPSRLETEIASYISSIYNGPLSQNVRHLITPYQLDLLLPDLNIGIECNGSYWHSELNGRDRLYHINKTKRLAEKNIRLIHIWEHQWANQRPIVESMLSTAVGQNHRIYARDCQVKKISPAASREFLSQTHLQGSAAATVHYGLFWQNKLVSVMSFGQARFNKQYQWELIRFASKLHTTVVGGASKLFRRFIRDFSPTTVLSYCDLSFSAGNLYQKLGFEFSHNSNPNYFYTANYKDFFSRHKFQKHRLKNLIENFNPALSEWENMKANGWDRIWDCGNGVYIFKL